MRVRHKPWAIDMIKDYPNIVIPEPDQAQGKWDQVFDRGQPLHVEVGTGKGQFLIGMAKAHPEINYVGIEMYSDVLVMALQKVLDEDQALPNLRFIRSDGREISNFFEARSLDRLYLNFSDPWPKRRHTKRRLTSPNFLAQYQEVLKPEGKIHFKTDNQGLFEYSLASMSQYGMAFRQVWLDLHASDFEGNIMTEYEEKFAAKGQPIYRLEAYYPQHES
ncbi:tRNA (guanosine(46)-N7)-methyltransferase TrmB [Aerococcus sanguinicola]|uniref:tRNA (guanosine(46)-N7)-methyltransferase TrmB n=1 Tax=unclassified Aerococcus TaxID=2618060 RepID=UPI0008A312F9|nr:MULTISPECIES: tRNA (guanosine(46)-N7)-methyltransferase TrmB [unclassified Aerococcus]KAB0645913.1 tRNA (guanosine(46)-N7)-methyltransferase TrmB [Aerococcus sanguinicola]MDK6234184.1 tRNA (guanosine(46)-N7)-methyltransferase TrmB [Aerococcus sp. UMB10185]MDK6856224.1 tRNA (guanosine(46)-N7)-methyltransferase TrmB [Aerococcus sp. UMB7533]OFN00925.1 tRNA (guanosine(46)-N7)-methyltransferase TrmB [Aerococcus sp. HMSC062A02]OHO44565.1 tRNA (guanosine(46)-N7)-methyltransferase TrmB [Aerococcus 